MKICTQCKKNNVKKESAIYCSWHCYCQSRIGKKQGVHSDEHKKNIQIGLKKAYISGRRKKIVYTDEMRKKMSVSHIGIKGYWCGKKRPELTGENHYNWKGGNYKLERSRFTAQVRNLVFKRDSYTCQLCGKEGGYLHVDHIQKWSEYVEGRFSINNCRTVCRGCHYFVTFNKPMLKDNKWGIKTHYIGKGGGLSSKLTRPIIRLILS
jgi:hypothetical protein